MKKNEVIKNIDKKYRKAIKKFEYILVFFIFVFIDEI